MSPPTERRLARMREVLERRQLDLHVVIENVHDPYNASAILRSADGFGAGEAHLLYWIEQRPKISKGVSGFTHRWVARRHHDSVEELIAALCERGLRILATHVEGEDTRAEHSDHREPREAQSYLDVDWTLPTAIVLGNEHRGVSPELLAHADGFVTIPMQGMAQSLNVSVTAAVILAEAYRQRAAAGMFEGSWDAERQRTLDEWIARDEER